MKNLDKSIIDRIHKPPFSNEDIKTILRYTSVITGTVLFIWLMFWSTKILSYKFMYEDMVKETVHEMVLEDSLKYHVHKHGD